MNMDLAELEELLRRLEGNTLDFKAEMYSFGGDGPTKRRNKAKFLKDIVCMWNTPREEPAHIICGVNKHPDGTSEVVGVGGFVDDADLQQQMVDFLYPLPTLEVIPVVYHGGKKIAVLKMPVDRGKGPVLPTRELGGILRRYQVYCRQGSRNSMADPDAQRRIYAWFGTSTWEDVPQVTGDEPWQAFMGAVHAFSPAYHYLLIADRNAAALPSDAAIMGRIPWSLVLDFDPGTEAGGLLSVCRAVLERTSALHYVLRGDRPTINPRGATYWYFARGREGVESTLVVDDSWPQWNRSYGRDLHQFLDSFAGSVLPSPVCCIALWNDQERVKYLDTALAAVGASLGDSVSYTILDHSASGDTADSVARVSHDHDAAVCRLPMHHLCNGLAQILHPVEEDGGCRLPSSSGTPLVIAAEKLVWLAEELELVGLEIGLTCPEGRTPGRDFLRGHEVSWYDLGLRYDVERDVTRRLCAEIRQGLGNGRPRRLNLFHAPGAGGTTVARRVLWDFHKEYPCVIVQRAEPTETVERLQYLSHQTELPVLAVVDGGRLSDRDIDALYEGIASRHLPVVVLHVQRSCDPPMARGNRMYLQAQVTDNEAPVFLHFLAREAPDLEPVLERAIASRAPHARTPFYLGLLAFEHEFVGIDRYVDARLSGMGPAPRRVVSYLALAHLYGQQSIPAAAFSGVLGVPRRRRLDLRLHIEQALDLLVESSDGRWRTAHPLIAEACLQCILGRDTRDPEAWKYGLSSLAKDFVAFCRGDDRAQPVYSEDSLEIVRRTFVYRDSSEFIGTERSAREAFAPLIEALPSKEAGLEVLRHLTDCFPEEAHFWGHLARYLFIKFRRYEEAEDAVDRALKLNAKDHVIHHMKGMILRARAYDLIQEGAELAAVVQAAEKASACFAEARTFGPDDEHGYVSEVQLIVRVLDHAGRLSGGNPVEIAASPGSSKWLRESLQLAEDLLLQVRQLRRGEARSEYEQRCRASLDRTYGRFDQALQAWQNLLDRQEVYAPPIRRQIAWTYLARGGRSWDRLQQRELDRIRVLLEQNLDEKAGNDRDLRLWLQAVRRCSSPPTTDAVIEQVACWHSSSHSLDAAYYLYVLYALDALDGSVLAANQMLQYLEESRELSRFRRNRARSFEWLGGGEGIARLVHQDQLGEWDESGDFWEDSEQLERIEGVIKGIRGPQAGRLELPGRVQAFFVPGRSGHRRGLSENRRVSCFVGFSYDGLRGWSVEDI